MNTHATPNPEHDLQPIPDWPAQRARSSVAIEEAPMTHRIDWTALYAAFSEPFEPALIRYRAGATNRDKTQAQALPYVDPRAYEDRLNQLVPGSWEVTFEPWGNDRIICRLTIHGVTRSSTGEASDSPDGIAGTSAEAQAFKRACAKFGLGRHLYAITPTWGDYDPNTRKVTPPTPRTSTALVPRSPAPQAQAGEQLDGIGSERAAAMHRALEGAGIPNHQHTTFARLVLKRPIGDFAHLPVQDAATLWRVANDQARPDQARA